MSSQDSKGSDISVDNVSNCEIQAWASEERMTLKVCNVDCNATSS